MADDDSSETSDESLDVKSEKFDPLKAIYSSKIPKALSNAPIYDNVSKFESVLKNINTLKKDSELTVAESSRQRFLPHQEPVSSKRQGKWNLERKNVLSKMQRMLGPLGMLYGCMENRIRMKVYTRNARGIRGYIMAYVVAFDKHWNLALEDCYEVWSRKVKRKAPALGDDTIKVAEMTDINVPKTMVKKIEGKTETLERHVPQMLLRGEQVAIIIKIN